METERWLPIVGWEGLYEVSDLGRVRSSDRKYHSGQVLQPYPTTPKRYPTVTLSHLGRRRRVRVHTLVLETFAEPCPLGMQGLHANDNVDDNWLTNLSWGTPIQNAADRERNGNTYRRSQQKVTV